MTYSHNMSPTAARREREFRQREDLILDAAESLLRAHGYLGLNLDHLAEKVEYSKGTLYNHFETKEDIVLALATRHLAERSRLFELAAAFQGRTREQMAAVWVADDVLAQGGGAPFQIMQLSKTPSLWEKASAARREESTRLVGRCAQVGAGVVRAAIAAGDLKMDAAGAKELSFGLTTMALGTHLVANTPGWGENASLDFPRKALRANQHRLLDGVGWQPLSTEWDYAAAEARIRSEVFPSRNAKHTAKPR